MTIASLFDESTVDLLATPQSVARGRAYAHEGVVAITEQSAIEVQAKVRGTTSYRVRLSAADGVRRWSCTCPVGATGEFCKHAVAVVLSVADPSITKPVDDGSTPKATPPDKLLATFLASLDTDELTALIEEQASIDERFHTRLLRLARLRLADTPTADRDTTGHHDAPSPPELDLDIGDLKKEITAAFGRGFVSYREAPAWAAEVNEVIEWIADIGDAGHFETAALLAEHAHKRTETAAGRVDDSDGWITEMLERIGEIHAAACAEGAFSPTKLARRLIKLELNAELDTFHRSAISHRDGLGDTGLALYGKLAQEAFDALPTNADRYGKAFRVRQARIGHAIAANDPDRLIEVMADDIGSPYDHLEIVDALIAAGRQAEALEWTEISMTTFPDRDHQLGPIRDRRAELLLAQGDGEAVVAMHWDTFTARPRTDAYHRFVDASPDADEARRQAIAHVMKALPDLPSSSSPPAEGTTHPGDAGARNELIVPRPQHGLAESAVAVLLTAQDDERAWTVATTHGASTAQWLQLAEHRQLDDPESSIAVFAAVAEVAIEEKQRHSYTRATQLLGRAQKLATATDRVDLFEALLSDIRTRHKRKSSLMAMLKDLDRPDR